MATERPLPLSVSEHRELGNEIRLAHARLRELCALVVEVYGPANRASFSFIKVTEAMDRLCQDMQTQASRELAGYPVGNLYI